MSNSFKDAFPSEEFAGAGIDPPPEFSARFNLLERLASNAFGETYLLSEKDGGKRFVLKLRPKSAATGENGESDESGKNSEAKLLSGLSHAGLPKFEGESENADTIFLLREYAKGEPLDAYVAEHGPLDEARAVHIALELCDILSYLHSRPTPVIHRDIKPSNIIYNPADGKVTLIDFGISRRYSKDSDTDTFYFGTKKFAPPEQSTASPRPIRARTSTRWACS
jgi:serine/threonine-protein kinase